MNSTELKKVIHDYLAVEQSSYALLIDGAWGSGKTRFIQDAIPEDKMIYVSLFGATSIKDVEDQLFSSITNIQEADSKSGDKVASVFGGIVNSFTEMSGGAAAGIASALGGVVKKKVIKSVNSDKCIVFDDFERSLMCPKESLSIISSFVEHEGVKCVILADEANIKHDQKADYDKYKEKVVGFTNTLKFDASKKHEIVVNSVDLSGIQGIPPELAERSSGELKSIIELFELNNLRTLIFAYSCYKRILEFIINDQYFAQIHGKHEELIFPCVAFAYAIKELQIDCSVLERISKDPFSLQVEYQLEQHINNEDDDGKAEAPNKEQKFLQEFAFETNKKINFHSVYVFIQHGYIDKELLKQDLAPHSDDSARKIVLWNGKIGALGDEEYTKLFSELITDLENAKRMFDAPMDIYNAYKSLYYQLKNGAYDIDVTEFHSLFVSYVNSVINDFNSEDWDFMRFNEKPDDKEDEIYELLRAGHEKSRLEYLKSTLKQNVINVLNGAPSYDADYKFLFAHHYTHFLEEKDAKMICDTLVAADSHLHFDFGRWLSSRFDRREAYENEKAFVDEFLDFLDVAIKSSKPCLRTYHLSVLSSVLGKKVAGYQASTPVMTAS